MAEPLDTQSAPGLERGLSILEWLAVHPGGATLSQLVEAVQAPNASVFRLCKTLEQLGYLQRDHVSKRFSLTQRFLQLSQPVANQRTLSEAAIEPMRQVRIATGETTQLCCRSDCDMVILEQLLAIHPFKYSADLGARCPLYSCAPGKAMLAFLPAEEQKEVVSRLKLKRFTPHTITTKSGLYSELASIQEAGYALDRAEGLLGIRCVAAPIKDRHGYPLAAITIAGPEQRIPEDEYASIGAIVKHAAHLIEEDFNS